MGRKRLRPHRKRAMQKRLAPGKKPMSAVTKADRKKKSEIDRARTKAALEKRTKAAK
jgi:hypothetical protein